MRQDIDEGAARDKVAAPDPAAAPLGTGHEAAGTPADAKRRAIAVAHEHRRPLANREPPPAPRRTPAPLWFAWGLALPCAVLAGAWWLVSR